MSPERLDKSRLNANPEVWEVLKQPVTDLLDAWVQLPAKYQVHMALLLIESSLAGPFGSRLRDSLRQRISEDVSEREKFYPVLGVGAAELESAGFDEGEIARFNESDLQDIAEAVREQYYTPVMDVFLDEVRAVGRWLLDEKSQ